MAAGKLKHRLLLQGRTETKDDRGGRVLAWVDVTTVWAGMRFLAGAEIDATKAGGGQAPRVQVLITLRWCLGVTESMRLLHGTRAYNIRAVDDYTDPGAWLYLRCEADVSEGI